MKLTALLSLATLAASAQPAPPHSTPPAAAHADPLALPVRVADTAGILGIEAEVEFARRLAALEARTGRQVAIVTVPDLDGQKIEPFTTALANRWAASSPGLDNGAVILVARDDRRVRIATSGRLRPLLPDSYTRRIIRERMLPLHREGDHTGAVRIALDSLLPRLGCPPRDNRGLRTGC